MSETKQFNPPTTSSIDEQQSSTQEISSADRIDISTEPEGSAPVNNESVPTGTGQTEQPVIDGSAANGDVTINKKTDQDSEAQQYERFESQMFFGDDTPEAINEKMLTELVKNECNIMKLGQGEVDSYVLAIKSTFSSNMIQGLASRSAGFKRMLLIGDACNVLKPIVRSSGHGWEDFIEDRLGKELLSTIGTYMRLAKIKGVKNHSYLGKDRILKVFSMRKKITNLPSKSSDPIGDILNKLKIVPINTLFDDVTMFNKRVDAALFANKIKRSGIVVPHKKVIELASTRFNFKNSGKHLKAMLYLKDNSDNPSTACQKYLNNILENDGVYNGTLPTDEADNSRGEDDFLKSVKESYATIRTSLAEGKELSAEEKAEIKVLVDYLNKLIA